MQVKAYTAYNNVLLVGKNSAVLIEDVAFVDEETLLETWEEALQLAVDGEEGYTLYN